MSIRWVLLYWFNWSLQQLTKSFFCLSSSSSIIFDHRLEVAERKQQHQNTKKRRTKKKHVSYHPHTAATGVHAVVVFAPTAAAACIVHRPIKKIHCRRRRLLLLCRPTATVPARRPRGANLQPAKRPRHTGVVPDLARVVVTSGGRA